MAPQAKLTSVKIDAPKMDLARNPRQAFAYAIDEKDMKTLIADIVENGYRSDKPILLSDRGKEFGLWVIQGHRRLTAAREVHRLYPDRLREIPAMVYTGLSMEDELLMLVDQFNVKTLNEYEGYLAVKRLLLVPSMTEAKIAAHVGMSRGWVQRRTWIAKFPPEVEQQWERKVNGEEGYLPITDPVLQSLKKAYEEDKEVGLHQQEGGGPTFRKVWEGVKNRDPVAPKPKALTRDDMLEKTEVIRDKIIISVIRYCAGDSIDIKEVQDQLSLLYAKANSWDQLQRDNEKGEDKKQA